MQRNTKNTIISIGALVLFVVLAVGSIDSGTSSSYSRHSTDSPPPKPQTTTLERQEQRHEPNKKATDKSEWIERDGLIFENEADYLNWKKKQAAFLDWKKRQIEAANRTANYSALPEHTIVKQESYHFAGCLRYGLRVRVNHALSRSELVQLSTKIIKKDYNAGPYNAICIYYYLPGTNTDSVYTAGMAEWCPYGDWGRADEVRTGDYSKHRFNIKTVN